MNDLVKRFKVKSLKQIPHLRGRIATDKDLKEGRASFRLAQDRQENSSKPAKLKIPFLAYQVKEKKLVVVIQAEETINGVTVGLRYENGTLGVCMLDEIKEVILKRQ